LTNIKSGINGNIWEKGGHLKPEVREKLLKIAELFYESLHIDFPIIDIYFTGSLANYNWTSQSDIDVHLILDIPNEEDKDFLAEYIDAKKESWKNKHDIKIYGFPVELFAKDSEDFHKNKFLLLIVLL
jgi:predicted nucleotidyltransferase